MPHEEIPEPYEPRAFYPHLGPADVKVWTRFILENPERFERVWYDFRVGDEDPEDLSVARATNENWWDLTYWRIDVVGEDAEKFYIIEIKPNANSKAIGQALAYAALFTEDESPKKPVVAVVITDLLIPTTARIAQRFGVELWTP